MKRARKKYAKLNHLQITVRDAVRSRDWYVKNIGLKVEFEVPSDGFVALEDDWGMALLINRGKPAKFCSILTVRRNSPPGYFSATPICKFALTITRHD